jgi:hypothetical protein
MERAEFGGIRFNLANTNDIYADKRQLGMDLAKRDYLNTCFRGMKIKKILAAHSFETHMLLDEDQTWVTEGTIVCEGIILKPGTIVHNVRCLDVTNYTFTGQDEAGDISIHTNISRSGMFTVGMILPVRIDNAMYPQNIQNQISAEGHVLSPLEFSHNSIVSPSKSDDEKFLAPLIDEYKETKAAAQEYRRCVFFKMWLFPHKDRKKTTNIFMAMGTKSKKCYAVSSYCDPAECEMIHRRMDRAAPKMEFRDFAVRQLNMGIARWLDIIELCRTYESDVVYDKHRSMWDYYDSLKDAPPEDDFSSDDGGVVDESLADEAL